MVKRALKANKATRIKGKSEKAELVVYGKEMRYAGDMEKGPFSKRR